MWFEYFFIWECYTLKQPENYMQTDTFLMQAFILPISHMALYFQATGIPSCWVFLLPVSCCTDHLFREQDRSNYVKTDILVFAQHLAQDLTQEVLIKSPRESHCAVLLGGLPYTLWFWDILIFPSRLTHHSWIPSTFLPLEWKLSCIYSPSDSNISSLSIVSDRNGSKRALLSTTR